MKETVADFSLGAPFSGPSGPSYGEPSNGDINEPGVYGERKVNESDSSDDGESDDFGDNGRGRNGRQAPKTAQPGRSSAASAFPRLPEETSSTALRARPLTPARRRH